MLTGSYTTEAPDPHTFPESTRILLVDDHPFVREGIKATLEQQLGFVVVGEVGDGNEVLGAVLRLQPDVVVLDHVLPGLLGLQVAEKLVQQVPGTHIIMMSMYEDDAYIRRALAIGVRAYVAKRAASSELVQAIHSVMAGKRYLSAPHSLAKVEGSENPKPTPFDVYKTLTDREREVGNLIVDGLSSRQIATKLCISERTVETHRSHIKRKLGAKTTAEVVRMILDYRRNYGDL